MEMVPAALENQLTVPLPPLMTLLRLLRLKTALLPETAHNSKGVEGEVAIGNGLSIRLTGTGTELHPFRVTTAYTVLPPAT